MAFARPRALVALQDLVDVVVGLAVGRDAAVPLHRPRAGVVGGQGLAQVAAVLGDEHAEVTRAAVEVLRGVEGVGHAQLAGGGRHELHEPLGALVGDGVGLEARFHADHRQHQVGVEPVPLRGGDGQGADVGSRGHGGQDLVDHLVGDEAADLRREEADFPAVLEAQVDTVAPRRGGR